MPKITVVLLLVRDQEIPQLQEGAHHVVAHLDGTGSVEDVAAWIAPCCESSRVKWRESIALARGLA